MMEKKVAFSFSKIKKPALIKKVNLETKEKIEYVDCFDGSKGKFSYKGTIKTDLQKQELVIPMPTARSSSDIVKSRIEEKLNKATGLDKKNNLEESKSESGKENSKNIKNLDELAALEILKEAQNESSESKNLNKLIIKTESLPEAASETDIDYDNIPVKEFGLAMLRGMGWRPDLGIGKEPRLVEAASPKLRPKGLGLGAQLSAETSNKTKKNEEKETYKTPSLNNSKKHK